jgi:hypothetical protein
MLAEIHGRAEVNYIIVAQPERRTLKASSHHGRTSLSSSFHIFLSTPSTTASRNSPTVILPAQPPYLQTLHRHGREVHQHAAFPPAISPTANNPPFSNIDYRESSLLRHTVLAFFDKTSVYDDDYNYLETRRRR